MATHSGSSRPRAELTQTGTREEQRVGLAGRDRCRIGQGLGTAGQAALERAYADRSDDRENAVFMFNGSGDAALIREGGDSTAVYVVMPMRV